MPQPAPAAQPWQYTPLSLARQTGSTGRTASDGVIGPNNPLAATTFALQTAATNVPITYILVTDGHGYNLGGVAGLFATDALIGIVACSLAWVILRRYCPEGFGARAESELAAVGEEA